jgi:hypothetical protein
MRREEWMSAPLADLERDLACESTLLPILRRLHDGWLTDVRAELGVALSPHATPWQRFTAVRYLDTVFQLRLHREADAVHGVAYLAAPAHGTSLLATVQMLDLLRMEIGELSQSPVSEQLVPPLLQAFLRQLEHWCADVEVALGWIRRDTLAPEGLEKFLYVSDDLAIASLE